MEEWKRITGPWSTEEQMDYRSNKDGLPRDHSEGREGDEGFSVVRGTREKSSPVTVKRDLDCPTLLSRSDRPFVRLPVTPFPLPARGVPSSSRRPFRAACRRESYVYKVSTSVSPFLLAEIQVSYIKSVFNLDRGGGSKKRVLPRIWVPLLKHGEMVPVTDP